MNKLEAVELYGGPLDGEWVEAIPHIAVTAFVYDDDAARRVQWSPYVLAETCGGRRQIVVGFYGQHHDPRRRLWRPKSEPEAWHGDDRGP